MADIFEELKRYAENYDEEDAMPEDTEEAIDWLNEQFHLLDD